MTAFNQIYASTNATLTRPASLIRAAYAGQSGWQRNKHLAKLLRLERCPKPGTALPQLFSVEFKLNEARKMRTPSYNMQRHVLVMIAILAELRLHTPQPVIVPGKASPKRP